MAGSLNKVILIGNLGADPEARQTQRGESVVSFRLATNESWTDREGQRQERTEWHRVVVFGKLAEVCSRYLRRGSKVLVEGQLRTRKWQDPQGQDRYATEIVLSGYASNMQMLDAPGGDRSAGGERAASSSPIGGGGIQDSALEARKAATEQSSGSSAGGEAYIDDDIPF